MAQILEIVRCYSCQTFQVQIQKKIKKWVCKVCHEKQSLKKVYGSGSGAECRKFVMELNMKRGEIAEGKVATLMNCLENDLREQNTQAEVIREQKPTKSKWAVYVDEEEHIQISEKPEDSDDDEAQLEILPAPDVNAQSQDEEMRENECFYAESNEEDIYAVPSSDFTNEFGKFNDIGSTSNVDKDMQSENSTRKAAIVSSEKFAKKTAAAVEARHTHNNPRPAKKSKWSTFMAESDEENRPEVLSEQSCHQMSQITESKNSTASFSENPPVQRMPSKNLHTVSASLSSTSGSTRRAGNGNSTHAGFASQNQSEVSVNGLKASTCQKRPFQQVKRLMPSSNFGQRSLQAPAYGQRNQLDQEPTQKKPCHQAKRFSPPSNGGNNPQQSVVPVTDFTKKFLLNRRQV